MGLPTCLTDPSAVIVADTSTVINLNATGCAREIIRAIPNKFVVVDVAAAELNQGRRRGRIDADLLAELVRDRIVEIVELDDSAIRPEGAELLGDRGQFVSAVANPEEGAILVLDLARILDAGRALASEQT